MAWIDIVILSVLSISALLSFFSGFVKETISLVALIAAVWVVIAHTADVAPYMPWDTVTFPTSRFLGKDYAFDKMNMVLAAGVLLLAVLVVGSVANYAAGRLIRAASLGTADRMLGVVFGVLRGAVIVVLLVMMVGLTNIPRSQEWQQSRFVAPFEQGAHWAIDHLPPQYKQHFSYSPVVVPDAVIQPQPLKGGPAPAATLDESPVKTPAKEISKSLPARKESQSVVKDVKKPAMKDTKKTAVKDVPVKQTLSAKKGATVGSPAKAQPATDSSDPSRGMISRPNNL